MVAPVYFCEIFISKAYLSLKLQLSKYFVDSWFFPMSFSKMSKIKTIFLKGDFKGALNTHAENNYKCCQSTGLENLVLIRAQ